MHNKITKDTLKPLMDRVKFGKHHSLLVDYAVRHAPKYLNVEGYRNM